jgi:hypothetical protein
VSIARQGFLGGWVEALWQEEGVSGWRYRGRERRDGGMGPEHRALTVMAPGIRFLQLRMRPSLEP